MKALVLLNTRAGKGSHESVREAIKRQFEAAGIEFEIIVKDKRDKPDEVVRTRVGEGFDLVVAAGGDGTVSDAFAGLYGTAVPLAIVPTGTGNFVAREFNIPADIEGAVALVAAGAPVKKIDAMKIGHRVYVLNAGVGINAAVIAHTSRRSKLRFGRLAYLAAILRLFGFGPRLVQVTIDGKRHRYRAVDVAVNNCGRLARTIYPPGPDIRPDDGHVEVWILHMETPFQYLQYLAGVLFGRRRNARCITARERVVIDSPVAMAVLADGDIIGVTPLEVEVLPGALSVLVPPGEPSRA